MEGCKRYDVESVGECFNMLMEKDGQNIIAESRRLIKECLQCENLQSCEDKYRLTKLLDENVL